MEPEWAAFAAIDWADQKHFWRLVLPGSERQEYGEMDNTPEAVDVWATGLHQRFGGRPIAVCLEQSRGALVCLLAKYPHLVLFPVHPKTAADYRQTFVRREPRAILRYGLPAGSADSSIAISCASLQPDTVETRLMQFLAESGGAW